MKTDQVDVVARTMLGDFEQIDHTQEAGLDGQLMRNVEERDLLDRIHLDFAFPHAVTTAHLDLRALPDANATGDDPALYTFPKALCENHTGMAGYGVATGLE